jgi:hypothetical protein
MAWYVRAVERALGLPAAVVDELHVRACLEHLKDLVKEQIDYHKRSAGRCHRMEHRLHNWGMTFLFLTLFACALHLFLPEHLHQEPYLAWLAPNVLTFLCGFLPASGAAMAGINNQGEFRRIERRSKAMEKQLQLLLARISALDEQTKSARARGTRLSAQAAALSAEVAGLLVNEVLDWRVVFLDRPLVPPA